jgi:hypothetical protein
MKNRYLIFFHLPPRNSSRDSSRIRVVHAFRQLVEPVVFNVDVQLYNLPSCCYYYSKQGWPCSATAPNGSQGCTYDTQLGLPMPANLARGFWPGTVINKPRPVRSTPHAVLGPGRQPIGWARHDPFSSVWSGPVVGLFNIARPVNLNGVNLFLF